VTGPAMPKLISECIDDVTVYLVVNDFGTPGCAFVETGISEANRETVLRNFLTGQYSNAHRVVVAQHCRGLVPWCFGGLAGELLERAYDGDDILTEVTKRFITRHLNLGEKRPPAPSVRRRVEGRQRVVAARGGKRGDHG
jgi:hypothetical protein